MFGLSRTYWILWSGALINRLGGFVLPLLAFYLSGARKCSRTAATRVIFLGGLTGAT